MLLLLACAQPEVADPITGIAVSLSEEIPAVVVVSWESERTDDVVCFGVGDQILGETAGELSDGRWRAVLVGIPPETTGWLMIGSGETWSEAQSVTTGASIFPSPDELSGAMAGYTLTTYLGPGDAKMLPLVLNGAGEAVWWHTYDGDREGFSSRTRLSADGRRIYYNIYHITLSPPQHFAGIVAVSLDGETVEATSLPESHHDFLLHEDGTIAYLQYDRREMDGMLVAGDALVERAPDGTETVIWTTWEGLEWDGKGMVNKEGMFWSLANNLEYDPDSGTYLLGLRDRNEILQISRQTGGIDWILGGPDGTLGQTDVFIGQHGFQRDGDDLLVFDNRGATGESRVIRYTIDAGAGTATTDWTWVNDPLMFTEYFGDVRLLPDDGLLIAWGLGGRLSALDADRQSASERAWGTGTELGFVTWEPTLTR
jgi:hypothetical protein